MSEQTRRDRGRPVDAPTLKALAHPLRLELLELLLDEGPSTASALGRAVGESSGTTSYHLRRLADVGLIEEATEVGTGRDRHWRAVSGWSVETDVLDGPETRADARMVIGEVTRRNVDRLRRYMAEEERWPTEWRTASTLATSRLVLTRDQLADLGADLLAVIDRYRQQQHDRARAGTSTVITQINLFPTGDPPP